MCVREGERLDRERRETGGEMTEKEERGERDSTETGEGRGREERGERGEYTYSWT